MIDPSEYVYFLSYGVISLCLIVAFIRIKSEEGVVITTREFQNFQTGFISGYSAVILCELIASASFYHTFVSLHLSLEQITKLYLTTIIASTVANLLNEVVEISSRKEKCILSAFLYSASMFSIFFGGHYEMLLMGRIVYGVAQALQQNAFETYALHEHASRGFPEDWLSHTFSVLTHTMALMAALSGIVGQIFAGFGNLGCVAFCCILFVLVAVYLLVVWEKDVNVPRFMMSGFLYNFNQAVSSLRSNRQMLLLLIVSSLCETSIIIFTFYWAPWLTDLSKEENKHLPYEIIFSSFVISSMFGNYLFQIFVAKQNLIGVDQIFQILLISSSTAYFLGATSSTPIVAYLVSLVVQCCVGMYWPSIGFLRGKIILPELRNTFLLLPKIVTLVLALVILSSIHHSPLLMLASCAVMNGLAAYIQIFYLDSRQIPVLEDSYEDEEL